MNNLRQVGLAEHNFTGLNVGGFVEGGRSQATFIETFAPTGEETSRNSFGATRVGGGGTIGFGIPVPGGGLCPGPTGNSCGLVVEPFIQLEDPNTSTQFNFPGDSFIRVQSNFAATFGVKAGPTFNIASPLGGIWLFGTLGVSVEAEKLTLNFVPVSSSEDKTIAGFTTGFGVAVQPAGLQLFGMSTALSVEYRHTFWQTAHFNMPAASPLSNFAFQRDDDKVLAGIHFYPDFLLRSRARHSFDIRTVQRDNPLPQGKE